MTGAPGKPYASPNALRAAIVARAKTATRADPRFTVQERLRQFACARLLARILTYEPENWVLKGGVSLLARVPGARTAWTSTSGQGSTASLKRSARWSVRARSISATTPPSTLALGGERLSPRYRDLVDLVTISLSQRMAGGQRLEGLAEEAEPGLCTAKSRYDAKLEGANRCSHSLPIPQPRRP